MNEYYDPGFTPRINGNGMGVGRDLQSALELWHMPEVATPAPTMREMRAAVWYGQRLNKFGEFAIIAVALSPYQRLSIANAEWYSGIGREDEVLATEDPLTTMLETATLPVSSPAEAIVGLARMLPTGQFPINPLRLLPRRELLTAATEPA